MSKHSKLSNKSKLNKQSKTELQNNKEPVESASVSKSKAGLPEGWTRATFIVREEFLSKIKDVAYWDRKEIKEVIDEALEAYLSGRRVKPTPKKSEE